MPARKGRWTMNTFLLNVTACDRVFFEGYCRQVILPLEDGEKGIQAASRKYGVCR